MQTKNKVTAVKKTAAEKKAQRIRSAKHAADVRWGNVKLPKKGKKK